MDSVKEIIDRKIFCILPTQSVAEASFLMDKERRTELLIVKEDDRIKGIVTSDELKSQSRNRIIADIPIKKIEPIELDTSIEEAYYLLESKQLKGIPVVNKEGKIIGIIYRHKIVAFLINSLKETNQKLLESKREVENWAKTLEEKVKERTFELSVLYEVSNAISYTLDYQQLLKLIMESLFKIVDYDICASLLFGVHTADITLKLAYPESAKFVNEVKSSLIDSTSILTGENIGGKQLSLFSIPISTPIKPKEERRFDILRSFFNVPFIVRGKTVGMINVSSCKENAFSEDDIKLIYTIASQASNAIERLQAVITTEKSKMKSVVESMVEGVVMIDERGELAVLNPQARRMLGFELDEEVTSRALNEKIKVLGLDKTLEESQGKERLMTKEIAIPQGEKNMVLRSDIAPVKDAKGDIIGIVTILRDITEEKEIDRMKTEFISIVSHELRTPLSITKEGISLVLDQIPGQINEKQAKILTTAKSNIDRLARIINSLLDISKIEAGKMELKRGQVDIIGLIRRVVSSFESKAKEKGLQLRTSFPKKRIDAYVDADRITQVFTNLVGNALKFTEKGYIEISAQEKENEVECAVADTGIGISKEDLPRVFSKFQQFGRSAGAGEKGTGLGLSIGKEIVERHNGKIWVESPPAARLSGGQGRAGKLGQGTKFTFTLPKYTAEEVLSERIENRILTVREEHKELSVFIIKLDNYSQIQKEFGKRRTQKIFLKVFQALKNTIRSQEPISLKSENEIVVLAEVGSQDVLKMNERLNRAIKESIFEVSEELEIDFSYGYATYPDDAGNGKELLGKARKIMVSERKERLKKSILVVDDEPKVVKALKGLLEKLGYNNLKEAYDGDEALQKVESEIPDLILLDMRMPKMSGYEVIGRLKENVKTKDIPILILSAYEVEINKLDRYTKKKAIPALGKPIDKGQLEKLVNYLL